jgi:2-oxoglutarate dehydrogenase E2 component (dihydrolipoamide succinyltransferase)
MPKFAILNIMAEKPILMPKMGESIAEATVIRWLKNVGEKVEKDEPIVEIATDKVDSEIPSTEAGILVKQVYKDGDVVKVGDAVAYIDADAPVDQVVASVQPIIEPVESMTQIAAQNIESQIAEIAQNHVNVNTTEGRFYSPLVLNIAREEGISMSQLELIPGTGKDGRVTKSDILSFVNQKETMPSVSHASSTIIPETPQLTQSVPAPIAEAAKVEVKTVSAPAISVGAGDEVIEMDRVRKLIADHMVMSKRVSPHVTSFVEADVTNLVNWRNKIKDSFKKREGENITFTPIFIQAIAKAIKDFPMINVSVEGDNKIVKKKNVNVGMAVAQQNGNLIVPVIKNADTMNLLGITRVVNDLAARARINKLTPDEIQGGTYTVTNVGSFGNVMGTPVINQPQVAIMAVGAIRKKPAVLETEFGDVIAIRHMMYLSHSYDHRVVDGGLGGMFVRRVADYLEQWDINTEI